MDAMFLLIAAVAGLIVLVLGYILLSLFRASSVKELMAEKERITQEIKLLEGKYFKRGISQSEFDELFRKKQEQLISVEAKIANKIEKIAPESSEAKDIEKLASKKKHIAKELLKNKTLVLKEMQIARKKYLKRKIDDETYKKLVLEDQQKLIGLEAGLKQLFTESATEKIVEDIRRSLASLKKSEEQMVREKRLKEAEEELRIAREIAEQMDYG